MKCMAVEAVGYWSSRNNRPMKLGSGVRRPAHALFCTAGALRGSAAGTPLSVTGGRGAGYSQGGQWTATSSWHMHKK